MKKLLVFILILASKAALACGFYPYGDELRFSFLNPDVFGYQGYKSFNYSANSFYYEEAYSDFDEQPNEKLWLAYCKNKVSYAAVREALIGLTANDIVETSSNEMIQYLFKKKDKEAINYLRFAKNCEFFNSWEEDPWERNEGMSSPMRNKLLSQAIASARLTKKDIFKYRYSFLAIRLAYYEHDKKKIRELFSEFYEKKKDKDILYYWSLYFRTLSEENTALTNYYAAQVFVNAPDKRFMTSQQYNVGVPIEDALAYAKSDKERANVYLLASIKTPDKCLEYIKKVYQYDSKLDGLSFLLLRETNKAEDWIFTPYYSQFEPSINSNNYWINDEDSEAETNELSETEKTRKYYENIMKRVESDRAYAGEVLQFIASVDLNKVDKPDVWKTCKAYLLFMTRDYKSCLTMIGQLDKKDIAEDMKRQLEVLKAMVINADQEYGQAIILDEIKPLILKYKNNAQFIFALGKELEYKGNTTDAALLYSALKYSDDGSLQWKAYGGRGDTYSDFYTEYFEYVNAKYTPTQVEAMIQNILNNWDKDDEFSIYKYTTARTQMSELYDLLGTKYIRQNRLSKALASFRKVNNKLWNDKYSDWEHDEGWNGHLSSTFSSNPFYDLTYTPSFIPVKDTMRLNKYTITRQLIKYINKAENVKEKNRDYYYFLVANCYYNMSYYGNCWVMRRYYWSSNDFHSMMEDDAEYHECNSAKTYYLLALKNAKTDKFRALCLRMIGRCEKNKLNNRYTGGYDGENLDSYLFSKNRYYLDLQNKYPDYYKDLTSDCSFFEDYFKARR